MLKQTPSQTVGPFFHLGLIIGGENNLVSKATKGRRIFIRGVVRDGKGEGVPDAMIEIWQADSQGIHPHPADPRHADADPNFTGFGRAATDGDGRFWFKTIKPGRIGAVEGQRQPAPHLNLRVFARGMLSAAHTRLYFSDEPSNAEDAVLNSIAQPERRRTLIAQPTESRDLPTYGIDIVLQGDAETLFFSPLKE